MIQDEKQLDEDSSTYDEDDIAINECWEKYKNDSEMIPKTLTELAMFHPKAFNSFVKAFRKIENARRYYAKSVPLIKELAEKYKIEGVIQLMD